MYTPDGVSKYTRTSAATVPNPLPDTLNAPPVDANDAVDGCTYGVVIAATTEPTCTPTPKFELPYTLCDTTAAKFPIVTAFVSPTLTTNSASKHTTTAALANAGVNATDTALLSVLNLDPAISTRFPPLLRATLNAPVLTTGITAATVATFVNALLTPFTATMTLKSPALRSVIPESLTVKPVALKEPSVVSTDARTIVPAAGVTYTRASPGALPKLLPAMLSDTRWESNVADDAVTAGVLCASETMEPTFTETELP
jgi:hypothetical protein